jgi:hypothetical protein
VPRAAVAALCRSANAKVLAAEFQFCTATKEGPPGENS